MARILITSGPTREYLDPVRYLSNASSGRMGAALAVAALAAGHEVVIVSGPVEVQYPEAAEVVPVVSTREMLDACREQFTRCDGLIATAAPCDYGRRSTRITRSRRRVTDWYWTWLKPRISRQLSDARRAGVGSSVLPWRRVPSTSER